MSVLKYLLFKNGRGYIENRKSIPLSELSAISFCHTDGLAARGYAIVGGERYELDVEGKINIPKRALSYPYMRVKVKSKDRFYTCEGITAADKVISPEFALSEEGIELLLENERLKKRVYELESRVKALEDISYGHDLF